MILSPPIPPQSPLSSLHALMPQVLAALTYFGRVLQSCLALLLWLRTLLLLLLLSRLSNFWACCVRGVAAVRVCVRVWACVFVRVFVVLCCVYLAPPPVPRPRPAPPRPLHGDANARGLCTHHTCLCSPFTHHSLPFYLSILHLPATPHRASLISHLPLTLSPISCLPSLTPPSETSTW